MMAVLKSYSLIQTASCPLPGRRPVPGQDLARPPPRAGASSGPSAGSSSSPLPRPRQTSSAPGVPAAALATLTSALVR